MKFLAEQPGRFFLDDLTDPPGAIRVGSACVIRPFGSGFVVAGGDGRLEVLAVSSTLEGAVAAALVEPECDRGDDPDREAALADGLRADAGARTVALETRARELVKKSTVDLLGRLAVEYGMSWSGIALAVGVSVQALRKWRNGGSVSIENKMALAKVVAILAILEERIEDPAGWLEMPVLEGYSLRHLDLLAQNNHQMLLDLAANFITPCDVLQSVNPNWRTEMYCEHAVFIAEDGRPAIRRR